MVFSLYCTDELIFVLFLCSILFFFNHCISVFTLLCFVFRTFSVGDIVTIRLLVITDGLNDGRPFLAARLSFTFDMHIYIFS